MAIVLENRDDPTARPNVYSQTEPFPPPAKNRIRTQRPTGSCYAIAISDIISGRVLPTPHSR